MAGELSNYQTSSQVSSAISSALSSYDNSSQVDSKIITALLDFYTQVETDQAIADAVTGGVDLSPSPLLPARGATWPTSSCSRRRTGRQGAPKPEIDDAVARAGFLDQTAGDARYLVRASRAGVRATLQLGPGAVHAPRREEPAPRGTAGRRCDSGQPVHAPHPKRLLVQGGGGQPLPSTPATFRRGPLRRRRWDFQPHPNAVHAQDHPEPAVPDAALRAAHPGQRQHPPDLLRLLEQGPVGHEVPPRRHLQLPDPVGHGLENSPGVAPTADLTVNSLTRAPCKRPCCRAPRPTSRSGTPPPRRHAAGLLRRRRHRQDVTVRSDRTLNATTADFARSSWAAGTFSSSSSVTATQEIESDLRCDPAASVCSPSRAAPTGSSWMTL